MARVAWWLKRPWLMNLFSEARLIYLVAAPIDEYNNFPHKIRLPGGVMLQCHAVVCL